MSPRGRQVALLLAPLAMLLGAELLARRFVPEPSGAAPAALFRERLCNGQPCFQRDPQRNLPWQPAYPVARPRGGVRLAAIGGSTVEGLPFPEAAFPRVLEQWLGQLLAPRPVEVLGAGVGGMYSDGELAVLRELLERDPDAVVLYSLHNEFHPRNVAERLAAARRGWRDRLRAGLSRLALGRLALGAVATPPRVEPSVADRAPQQRPIDGPEYRLVLEHCRANLEAAAELCAARGVPLLLCTVVANLREFPPLADVFARDTDEAARARWQELLAGAEAALGAGDATGALGLLAAAEALDSQPARLAFVRGRALLAAGQDDAARQAFRLARDTDGRLNRAVGELNDMVRSFAGRPGVIVVDLEAAFDGLASVGGIAGHEYIVDHLHPTVEGHAVIARELLAALAAAGLFVTPENLAAEGLDSPQAALGARLGAGEEQARSGRINLQLALEKGRWDASAERAHRDLSAAVLSAPQRADLHVGLGLLEGLRGESARSRECLLRAQALDPQALAEWQERARHSPLVSGLLRRAGLEQPGDGSGSDAPR